MTFQAFVASTEDEKKVREALSLFVPSGSISSTNVRCHYGNKMKILDAVLDKKEGLKFFQKFRAQLFEADLNRLRQEIPRRMGEDCKYHFRLDKQAAYKGEAHLADSGDVIQVCVHIASYPAKQDKAVKIAGDLI